MRRGRIATSVVYFTLGSMGGAWIGRLPDVQRELNLTSGMLGTVLLLAAFGGLAAMQLAPLLLRRYGHSRSLRMLSIPYPLTFLAIPFAQNAYMLAAALVLSSAMGSLIGILANTHAADVERAYERAIMSSFHAMFSVGSLIGAGVAGFLAGQHVSVLTSMAGAVFVHLALMAYFIPWLLQLAHASPKKFDASIDHLAHHPHRKAWWRGVLLVGSLTLVAYMAEAAIASWSAIFMREYRDAAPTLAVAAFMAFSACMTVGRLSGDFLATKFGKVAVVQNGALLASVGLFIGLCIPNMIAAIIGFSLVGLGLSVLVPLLFSIAGNLSGGESHAAIARVGTIAYLGVLAGPAVIGAVAEHYNLVAALLIPVALLLCAAIAASFIPQVVRRPSRGRRALHAARNWLSHAWS